MFTPLYFLCSDAGILQRELQNAAALNDKWSSGNIMSLNAALSGLPEAIDLQEWATSTINRATAGASSSSHLDGRVNAAGECLPSQEGQDDLSNPPLPSSSSLRDNTTETLAEVQAGVAAMTALVSGQLQAPCYYLSPL